jgi:hypothetical protein
MATEAINSRIETETQKKNRIARARQMFKVLAILLVLGVPYLGPMLAPVLAPVALASPIAPVMALTINTTDIDAMFDAVNNHIIPKAGETVSAMPSLIIPLAFLVVLLMILFFVPDVLYSMLEVIKGAIHKGKK